MPGAILRRPELLVASNVKDHRVGEYRVLVDGRTAAGDDDCIAELSVRLR
jgi:hypothetical protein